MVGESFLMAIKCVDCESLSPTQGAMQQGVDRESLTPTQGAMQQSVNWESLTKP